MAFGKKYVPRKIKVAAAAIDRDSPEVLKRLQRIEQNYSRLDTVLCEIESKIELDDRLFSETDSNSLPNKPR